MKRCKEMITGLCNGEPAYGIGLASPRWKKIASGECLRPLLRREALITRISKSHLAVETENNFFTTLSFWKQEATS